MRFENETVWLTQLKIAELFGVLKAAISKHVKNIFASGELVRNATVSKLETVQTEGGRTLVRTQEFFNLDVIIAVGYRGEFPACDTVPHLGDKGAQGIPSSRIFGQCPTEWQNRSDQFCHNFPSPRYQFPVWRAARDASPHHAVGVRTIEILRGEVENSVRVT